MKAEIKYIFECPGGFRYERETPKEIIDIFNENLESLKNDEKECKGRIGNINVFLDDRNAYLPKGTITFKLDGETMTYYLRTEIYVHEIKKVVI